MSHLLLKRRKTSQQGNRSCRMERKKEAEGEKGMGRKQCNSERRERKKRGTTRKKTS